VQASKSVYCCTVAVCLLEKGAHCSTQLLWAQKQWWAPDAAAYAAACAVCGLQGLKRCHSGSEVQGDLCQQEPSLKRLCGAMAPPPQLVLPSDQPFMADEPLLPAGATTAAATSYSIWRTGLTPRVGQPAAWQEGVLSCMQLLACCGFTLTCGCAH
jgi:hypothetical protein